jgi:type IV conjugative transfer system coupling protein TraD
MSNEKRPKHSNFTRGGQITFHNLRMFFQINSALCRWICFGVVGLTLLITYLRVLPNTFTALWYHTRNLALMKLNTPMSREITTIWEGARYNSTLGEQLNNPTLLDLNAQFWSQLQINFLVGSLLGFGSLFVIMVYFRNKGDEQTDDHFIRGIKKASSKDITQHLKAKGKLSGFAIDKHFLFKKDFEVQHTMIDGTTGAGKSVALRKLVRWIRKRGDKAIIYDKGCTFVGKFYNPETDTILNPFDERCANWDIWCDAKEAPDFENMAAALIPQHGEGDPFWVDSARSIFSSTSFKMSKDGKTTSTARLLRLMLTSELDTLGTFLKGTESASLVSNKIEKTAISIKSVLATYIKSLRFLEGLDDKNEQGTLKRPKFSISDWVQDDDEKGFLFLSSNAQQHASLRPLISMWLAIASNAMLGMEEDENRRIWVILDEMPTLHKLPELDAIIAEVRKFGGCYVIGIQSYAQLVKTYGKTTAEVIFDLLNTRFYFRAPSATMAKISALDLGEQEVDVSKENYSYGAHAMRDGVSLGHQTITRPVVSTAEIQTLDDLQCWVRLLGCNMITKLDLVFDKMPQCCHPFIKRNHALSPEMTDIYEQLTYCELMATQALDKTTRSSLTSGQGKNFEDETQLHAEWNEQKKAIKANKTKDLVREEKEALLTPEKKVQEKKQVEQENEATRIINEASTADIELGD